MHTVEFYKKQLNRAHKESCDNMGEEVSIAEFFAEDLFDFTTYEDHAAENIAIDMVSVIRCIMDGTNHQYLDSGTANRRRYFYCVNSKFLYPLLNWGTSIRGAWISAEKDVFMAGTCLIQANDDGSLRNFLTAVCEMIDDFVKENPTCIEINETWNS